MSTNRLELPGWARAADYCAATLMLFALTVALWGGVRVRVGDVPLNLTSPLRLVFWAAAVVGVRHAIARQHPIYRHLLSILAAWRQSIALRTAVITAIGTRPMMLAAGYMAVTMIGYAPGAEPFHDFESELLNLPLRWDTGWYLGIATRGYSYIASAGADAQQNIVFFPALPMLVRLIAWIGGNGPAAYVIGGTVLSLAAFALALTYLYLLARDTLTEDQSTAALWLVAAYPFAIFFGAIYTESLYLLGAAGAFYHFRRGEFLRAAAWGLLVGLTRPNGFFLCVPLAALALNLRRGREPRAWVAAAAPVAGMLLFSAFIWRLTGSPIAWASGHAAWGRHYGGLTQLVTTRYGYITSAGLLQYVSREPYDLVNGLGALFVIASAWPVARRFGIAYALFILVNILPPLADGGLMSAGRFSAVLFPAFFWLAAVIPARHRTAWIATFAAMQAFNATLFYTWRPLF